MCVCVCEWVEMDSMEERGIMEECRREEDLGHAGQMLPLSLRGD